MIIKSKLFDPEEQEKYDRLSDQLYHDNLGRGPEHILTSLLVAQNVYFSAMFEKIHEVMERQADLLDEVAFMMEEYNVSIPEAREVLDEATQMSGCNHSLLHSVDHTPM